jgi:hypothetical protein
VDRDVIHFSLLHQRLLGFWVKYLLELDENLFGGPQRAIVSRNPLITSCRLRRIAC